MASETEVAIKSEHLKNLRGEIDRLESEKAKITDWRKGEERKVDALKSEAQKINEEIGKKKNDLLAEQKKTSDLINSLRKTEEGIARQRGEIQYELSRLEESRKESGNTRKALFEREEAIKAKEADILKREAFIKSVFEGIERLK